MKRRPFFTAFTGLIAGTGLFAFPSWAKMKPNKKIPGGFIHHVFFWFKEPDNKEKNDAFLKSLTSFLDEVDEIMASHVGLPANTPREVVDNSYTVSLIVTFKDKAAHDAYQEHPSHKKFIKESSDIWEKVQIYDVIS
ncbi:MAG: Dabb family protein [Flammeovirgaceae bacterium]|nr:Dabb family protein [Flammeovirgaceae bacterium]